MAKNPLVELCDPKEYLRLRDSLFGKADDLKGLAGVGSATIQRLDAAIRIGANRRLEHNVALAIHKAFQDRAQEKGAPSVCSFPEMFKPAGPVGSGKFFTWREVDAFAKNVGKDVFGDFGADAVLTFSGHSALFANLVMVTTFKDAPEKLLNMPVYLAQQRFWNPPQGNGDLPSLPGFESLPGERFVILMPKALEEGDPHHEKRIAIIDDSVVSGEVPPVLRKYFQTKGYREDGIRIACAVSLNFALPRKRPNHAAHRIYTEEFEWPWGKPLFFGK